MPVKFGPSVSSYNAQQSDSSCKTHFGQTSWPTVYISEEVFNLTSVPQVGIGVDL